MFTQSFISFFQRHALPQYRKIYRYIFMVKLHDKKEFWNRYLCHLWSLSLNMDSLFIHSCNSNNTHYKVWYKITYPLLNFNEIINSSDAFPFMCVCVWYIAGQGHYMMTSPNGIIFRVTGHLWAQRPVTRSFDVFFDLRLDKRLSKQSWGWWFEVTWCPLWRHCNDTFCVLFVYQNSYESVKSLLPDAVLIVICDLLK